MPDDSFKEFVLDQLGALPELRMRAMFGAHGIYSGEQFFGILDEGRLFFKTDGASAADYTARDMGAFTYQARGKKITLGFHEVPPDVLENAPKLAAWAQRAIQLAATKKSAKRVKNLDRASMNSQKTNPISPSKRRARQLKITAIIVLLAGIISAGIIYWLGTRAADAADDLSMVGYNKPQELQMEKLYGKSGELIEDWSNALKQPGAQAIVILVAAALIAGGCFYFARLHDYDDENG